MNDVLAAGAAKHGALVDLHAHALAGDQSWRWSVHTTEPSLRGGSEVRRALLPQVLRHAGAR